MRRIFLGFALAAAFTVAGCRRDAPSPQPAPPPTPGPAAKAVEIALPPPTADATVPEDPRITELLTDIRRHGRCSLLMDCPPAVELVREGRAAVPAIVELLQASRGDDHWRRMLFDALGRLGGSEAAEFLMSRLTASEEPLRADIVFALGHARVVAALPILSELRGGLGDAGDPVLRLALDYALVRLGRDEARADLRAALGSDGLEQLHAGVWLAGLTVVRWLRDPEMTPFVLRCFSHRSRYVRRDAARVCRDLRLRVAVPALIPLLGDESSGVREASLEALRRLTGLRYKRTREQWERWCRASGPCAGAEGSSLDTSGGDGS